MTDLIKYQRAFQASSRVITMLDDLLDTVVNKLGA
jgi:flagellar hook-associated protein 1 FlgK